MINLSPKALRFTVDALEYRISAYEQELDNAELSEDQVSDLSNDLMFLEALLQDFKATLDRPTAQIF